MINSLIIGNGEIGSAILKILKMREGLNNCKAVDRKDTDFYDAINTKCKVLHICFPYSNTFVEQVIRHAKQTEAELVIIHSTVQVGTTKEIDAAVDAFVAHSPVQGQHPDLTDAILYFEKLVGTESDAAFEEVKKEFPNLKLVHIKNPDSTELGKMLSTSYYGVCIAWHREMQRLCDLMHVDFNDTVIRMNQIYNEGYSRFKPDPNRIVSSISDKFQPEVRRPILLPPSGSIGGHCVVQNARLLEEKVQSEFLSLIW